MTTIAYKDGVLAGDSLSTSNGLRDGIGQKVWRIGRLLVAACGARADCLAFRAWVEAGCQGDNPFMKGDGGNGIVVLPEGDAVCWGPSGGWPVSAAFYSLGSGYQIAIGAMERGASAIEAVMTAIRHDTCSGGPVQAMSLDGMNVRIPAAMRHG